MAHGGKEYPKDLPATWPFRAAGTVFMNGALANADNAALATSLFAPSPSSSVSWTPVGTSSTSCPSKSCDWISQP